MKDNSSKMLIDTYDEDDDGLEECLVQANCKRMTMQKDYDWAGNEIKTKKSEKKKIEKLREEKKDKNKKKKKYERSYEDMSGVWTSESNGQYSKIGHGSYGGACAYRESNKASYYSAKEGDLVFW